MSTTIIMIMISTVTARAADNCQWQTGRAAPSHESWSALGSVTVVTRPVSVCTSSFEFKPEYRLAWESESRCGGEPAAQPGRPGPGPSCGFECQLRWRRGEKTRDSAGPPAGGLSSGIKFNVNVSQGLPPAGSRRRPARRP